jgi:hypothetical protein
MEEKGEKERGKTKVRVHTQYSRCKQEIFVFFQMFCFQGNFKGTVLIGLSRMCVLIEFIL